MAQLPFRNLVVLLGALAAVPGVRAETAVRVSDIRPGLASGLSRLDAAVLGDKLYFNATDDGSARDLWVYDGVHAPTMVPGSSGANPIYLVAWQGAIYFLGGPTSDRELWRYDGVNPPVEALDLFSAGSGLPQFPIAFGPELCFQAKTSTAVGEELVCWDGVTAPDVYDIRTGSDPSAPESFAVIGAKLYFDAFDNTFGNEPRIYQNFSPPTLLADVWPGIDSSLPTSFVQAGGTIYFTGSDDFGAILVFGWDGINPPAVVSPDLATAGELATFGGKLLADGDDGNGNELHVLHDGGFTRAAWPFGDIFAAENFLEHRNALYFHAGPSISSGNLFRYCGGGVVERVTDQFTDGSSILPGLIVFHDHIFFAGLDSVNGGELWELDPFTALLCDGFEDGDLSAWVP